MEHDPAVWPELDYLGWRDTLQTLQTLQTLRRSGAGRRS